jgi:hypothetical protein
VRDVIDKGLVKAAVIEAEAKAQGVDLVDILKKQKMRCAVTGLH